MYISPYRVNVDALTQMEASEAKAVVERMDERSTAKRLSAQAAAAVADHLPHHARRHRHNRSFHGGRRKRSTGGETLRSATPSPLKKAQLLRQRKEDIAVVERLVEGGTRASSGIGVGESCDKLNAGRRESVREGEERGALENGRSEGDDASCSPAFARMDALQAASEGVDAYNRSDTCSESIRYVSFVRSINEIYAFRDLLARHML